MNVKAAVESQVHVVKALHGAALRGHRGCDERSVRLRCSSDRRAHGSGATHRLCSPARLQLRLAGAVSVGAAGARPGGAVEVVSVGTEERGWHWHRPPEAPSPSRALMRRVRKISN